MPNINTILVDDEQDALDSLEILLSEYPQIKTLKKISNPLDIFPVLMTTTVDLIFLDINMPVVNGIDLLEKIRECNSNVKIIMVTAYNNYAIKAIKHNVFSYLLKPVSRAELKTTVKKLLKSLEEIDVKTKPNKVLITSKGNTIIVEPNDVAYFEAEGNYTYIYLKNGSKLIASANMGVLVEKFPKCEFIKINRSTVVHKNSIISIHKKNKKCVLKLNKKQIELSVSTTFSREFNSIFNNV
ncbi:two component transcriptional regulator, LytTR family [Lutibacter oricola]|uniref:Two component transcriptional regulator, LytTR family n=1 Tax=Lutibacter oricola TaxID=762486 RepID=A0A1H3EI10_9FLAO|nr:LytTR family DNA-binding domain-containing protein [Lutibacter oricola]SDX77569.1 two component transcriptional regulator, LytTR family [Lutibacter oricola]